MTTEYSTELSPFLGQAQRPGRPERTLNIKRLIRLRLPLMAIVFVALAAPLSVAVWLTVPPEYQASEKIHFLRNQQRVLGNDTAIAGGNAYDDYVRTNVNLITSSPILSRVLSQPVVQALPLVKAAPDKLQYLMGVVSAEKRGDEEIVTIYCRTPDKQTSKAIVQTVVDEFLKFNSMEGNARGGENRRTLLEEQRILEGEVSDLIGDIQALRKEQGLPLGGIEGLMSEKTPYVEQLAQAESDLAKAQAELEAVQAQLSEVESLQEGNRSGPGKPVYVYDVENMVAGDGAVQAAKGELEQQKRTIAGLERTYQDGAQPVRVARDMLKTLEGELARRESEARSRALLQVKTTIESNVARAQAAVSDAEGRKRSLQERIDFYQHRADALTASMADVQQLERVLEQKKAILDRVRNELFMMNVESKAPGNVYRPENSLYVPSRPDNGKRFKMILLLVVFAGGVAGALGLLRELTDQHVRSPEDVTWFTDVPLIASIPNVAADRLALPDNKPVFVADHPSSTTADEVRRILTRILYPPEGSAELNTVLVVSPSQGDGKTSVACNLATALAMANRRVLVIDLSARRPRVEETLGLERGPGLSEVFGGEFQAQHVIRPTDYANLFALGPGFVIENVLGRLASRETVEFLEQAEHSFDHVIIDTPPSLLMSEAKLLAPIVDGVIVVVGVRVSSRGMVQRCLNELQQIGASVVGIVLNGLQPTRGGYMRRNLDLYYAYSESGNGAGAKLPSVVVPETDERQGAYASMILIDEEEAAQNPEDATFVEREVTDVHPDDEPDEKGFAEIDAWQREHSSPEAEETDPRPEQRRPDEI